MMNDPHYHLVFGKAEDEHPRTIITYLEPDGATNKFGSILEEIIKNEKYELTHNHNLCDKEHKVIATYSLAITSEYKLMLLKCYCDMNVADTIN